MDSSRTQVPNMLHLSSERLAELADGEPTIAEAEHLAACAICATERSAHQRLLTLAGDERDRIAPPLTNWASLSARLRELEIIVTPVPATAEAPTNVVPLVRPRPRRRTLLAGLRVAAGIVFALGFGALGRMSANAPATPSTGEMRALAERLAGTGAAVLPTIPGLNDDSSPFGTVEDALASLEEAQRQYDRAVAFIAAHDSTQHSPEAGEVYRARLAALDEMAETSRQALSVAPADPVLNQYYISTLGAREVTLRQLGSVLTDGKRITRF
jgi:hypothetical protein